MCNFICNHLVAIINSIGLILNVFGAFLIWKYGLPSETMLLRGASIEIIGPIDKADADKAKEYDRYSHGGFALLVIGFILQIISNFI